MMNINHNYLFFMNDIVWTPVKDYTEYEVSTSGKIRNSKTLRILKSCLRNGYSSITLSKNNKKKTVNIHVIVAMTYLQKPDKENQYIVNHINEDKQDNRLSNLEYVTYAQNTKHSATTIRTKNTKDYDLSKFTDIPNYNMYMISRSGDIYSKNIKRLVSMTKIPSGYLKIKMKSDNGKYKDNYIHVLMAFTYLDYTPLNRFNVINHKDGIKYNNFIENLEIVSHRQNMIHSANINRHKFFRKSVYYIKDNNIIEYESAKKASVDTRIDHSSIIKSCKSPNKLAGNIKWFYKKVDSIE